MNVNQISYCRFFSKGEKQNDLITLLLFFYHKEKKTFGDISFAYSSFTNMSATISNNWSQVLQDKVVFITGAGGGIGSAIARTSFLQGARVVVSDLNKEGADKVVAELLADDADGTKKDRLISLELDTASEEAIEKAVQQVVDQWKTVDVLVNAYVESVDRRDKNDLNQIFVERLILLWVWLKM